MNILINMNRNKQIRCLFVIIMLSGLHTAYSDNKGTISIADIKLVGIAETDTNFYTNVIFDTIFQYGKEKYILIDRDKRDKIINEQQFALSDLSDSQNNAIQIGKMLSAKYMIFGECGKSGSDFYIFLTMVDVTTTAITNSASMKTKVINELEKAIKKCVGELLNIDIKKVIKYEYPYFSSGIISMIGAIALIGGGAGTFYFYTESSIQADSSLKEYQNASINFDALWDNYVSLYQKSKALFWTSISLFVGGTVLTGLSIYFLSEKVEVTNSVSLSFFPYNNYYALIINIKV